MFVHLEDTNVVKIGGRDFVIFQDIELQFFFNNYHFDIASDWAWNSTNFFHVTKIYLLQVPKSLCWYPVSKTPGIPFTERIMFLFPMLKRSKKDNPTNYSHKKNILLNKY